MQLADTMRIQGAGRIVISKEIVSNCHNPDVKGSVCSQGHILNMLQLTGIPFHKARPFRRYYVIWSRTWET